RVEDGHLAGICDRPGLSAVGRVGDRKPAELHERVGVDCEVVPDVVEVAVTRTGRQRVLVRRVEDLAGRRLDGSGGGPRLAAVGGTRYADEKKSSDRIDGQGRVVHAAAAVAGQPRVDEVDVARGAG